jgi:hypothetical protein
MWYIIKLSIKNKYCFNHYSVIWYTTIHYKMYKQEMNGILHVTITSLPLQWPRKKIQKVRIFLSLTEAEVLTNELGYRVVFIWAEGSCDVLILNEWKEKLNEFCCIRWSNHVKHLQVMRGKSNQWSACRVRSIKFWHQILGTHGSLTV